MLDIKILTFIKVVETKSYTAAAEELHMTQPAVTQHIHRLEEHYGRRLIEFAGRSLELTEAGRIFYEYANLQKANETLLTQKLSGVTKTLRIGATLSIADYYLPDALNRYLLRERQGIRMFVANTDTLLERMIQGELDCAFVEGNFDRTVFEAREFCRARFLPAVSVNHPLAGKKVDFEELYTYPLILREPGSGTRALLENYLSQRNDSPESFVRLIEMNSFVMIKKLLQVSQAVSFVYEMVAAEEAGRGELGFLDIKGYEVSHPLHFIYLKNCMEREEAEIFYEKLKPDLIGAPNRACEAAGQLE